jgi:hypothetical protein
MQIAVHSADHRLDEFHQHHEGFCVLGLPIICLRPVDHCGMSWIAPCELATLAMSPGATRSTILLTLEILVSRLDSIHESNDSINAFGQHGGFHRLGSQLDAQSNTLEFLDYFRGGLRIVF